MLFSSSHWSLTGSQSTGSPEDNEKKIFLRFFKVKSLYFTLILTEEEKSITMWAPRGWGSFEGWYSYCTPWLIHSQWKGLSIYVSNNPMSYRSMRSWKKVIHLVRSFIHATQYITHIVHCKYRISLYNVLPWIMSPHE